MLRSARDRALRDFGDALLIRGPQWVPRCAESGDYAPFRSHW